MNEILAFEAVLFVCGTTAFVATLRFARRFLELRHERSLRAPDAELSERLQRIEIAVESTALEVERIAESNRFVAKLLADRSPTVAAPNRSPGRVITPH